MKYLLILLLIISAPLIAQPNCNIYLYSGDTIQYNACKLSEKFNDYYQFEMKGLAILDSCIAICPYFANAHYEIAVVYLKAGNFIKWSEYIDNAVLLDAENYLSPRASCRGKFFADYEGAINDIDSLENIVDYDIGFTHDGTYHLDAYRALCYKTIGNYAKSIELFEAHIQKRPDNIGLFDYIHLGIAYQKLGNHLKAIECFKKQEEHNNLAENQYYIALSFKALNQQAAYKKVLNTSKNLMVKNRKMIDPYHVLEDEIFLSDIEQEINASQLSPSSIQKP